ncbi:tyrosine-type recombinase/integrase [Providencia heimbachae]|uniref:Phage integrase n=1 Tax=Providencia heimbachae ATCC 35613 TaxID=1354272 RepID=A0A1B7K1H8_9GAMM|nr:site-specific integrase [Providencia heimbachae]OAT54021.1 phage integrase [Providencia heimbachae ATCC 35613]SQH13760.1 Putative prophage CPS-53 integrase [Providencia heimbachae]
MAISDTFLRASHGKKGESVIEKSDRDGLWIRISKNGVVSFFYRYRFAGKQDKMTIGQYPIMSLKEARSKVLQWARVLSEGQNPKLVKSIEADQLISLGKFEDLFRQWHSINFGNKKSADLVIRSFEIHVFPKLGKYLPEQLTTKIWVSFLDELSKKYTEVTKRVINCSFNCYEWARKRNMLEDNPLTNISPKDFGIKKKHGSRTLSDEELYYIFRACDESRMTEKNALFVKLCTFFACRVSELRLAKKADFDFKKMHWVVPAENHKTGHETGQPLIRPMIPDVLPTIIELFSIAEYDILFNTGEDYAAFNFHLTFPKNIIRFVSKNYGVDIPHFSMHDLRRTARTNFSELTAPHVAETMLGHKLPGVWGVYDKYGYMNEMREAYQKWWDKLELITKFAPK